MCESWDQPTARMRSRQSATSREPTPRQFYLDAQNADRSIAGP